MKNNNFIITKNDIYIAQVVSFIGVEETRLIYKDLSSDEIFRKVLLKDKTLIDFKTGDIILSFKYSRWCGRKYNL